MDINPEDWGWYAFVHWHGGKYLLGASHVASEGSEWVLQVKRHTSLRERLFGHRQSPAEDACVRELLDLMRNEPAFKGLELE